MVLVFFSCYPNVDLFFVFLFQAFHRNININYVETNSLRHHIQLALNIDCFLISLTDLNGFQGKKKQSYINLSNFFATAEKDMKT